MDTKRVTIKIPSSAKEKLDAIASKQRRNLVNTLEYALDLYLAMHESDGTTKYSLDTIIDQRTQDLCSTLVGASSSNINSDTTINESNEVQKKQEYTPLF